MAQSTVADVGIRELRRELAELRALVHEMDADLAKLEWHVEESDDDHRLWRYSIAGLMRRTFGPADEQTEGSWVGYIWGRLYPERSGGQRQHVGDGWRIPRRRWSQYGSREELVDLCSRHGLVPSRREGRQWLVRRLRRGGVALEPTS